MNILFVVPYVPSLVRVRPYNLIRHLAARGHAVTVATVWTNAPERAEVDDLRSYCSEVRAVHLSRERSFVNCLRALPTREPLQARYSWAPELEQIVTGLAGRADVVHVEHLRGARYGLAAARVGSSAGVPIVWDSVDCISGLFAKAVGRRSDRLGPFINRLELSRTRRHEGWLVSQFDRVLVTSLLDRRALLDLSPPGQEAKVVVLPNGVDLDYFRPKESLRHADTLVFSGKMSYHANESAALHLVERIMPSIWQKRPCTRLLIAGKDPSTRLGRAAAGHGARIALTGTVADLRPYLHAASVAAIPLVYGAGCQNKVLEAMACATPVVASPQAVSALQAEPGREVLVADSDDDFVAAVLDLLEHPDKARQIGVAGRAYVERHHRWERVAARLEQVYGELLATRGRLLQPA